MKFYTLLIFLFILAGCSTSPPHVREANYIKSSFTRKMKNEGLNLYMSGGAMREDIQEICLGFFTKRKMDLENARIFFLTYTENLLDKINNYEKIRPYLHDFPFRSKNIYFSIRFVDSEGNYVEKPFIAYIFINTSRDEIRYYTYNIEKAKIECSHIEPYQNALKIYHESMHPLNCISE